MVDNIAPTHSEQTSVFANLLDEMQRQGALITPSVPGGNAVSGSDGQQDPQGSAPTSKAAGSQTAPPGAPKAKIAGNDVTNAIENQGQLIQTAPQISASGSDNSFDEIKNAIRQLGSIVDTNQAQTQQAVANSGSSSSSGGGAGGFISDAIDVVTSVLSWIICTELVRQRRLPIRWYIAGSAIFAAYHPWVKEGYYLWAIPSVGHLRRYPNSAYSRLLTLVFNWRAENIAAHASVKGARKLYRGAAITGILWPVCFMLGCGLHLLNLTQDWRSVYGEKS